MLDKTSSRTGMMWCLMHISAKSMVEALAFTNMPDMTIKNHTIPVFAGDFIKLPATIGTRTCRSLELHAATYSTGPKARQRHALVVLSAHPRSVP